MKRKIPITISILAILALSACGGGDATPEISAEDIAATAVAQAWLVMTQTAAAAPTATPLPPTATPLPLNTLPPTLALLPTLPAATIAVVGSPTPDCVLIPEPEPKGAQVNVEFYNESGDSLNLSFGMNSPNDKNECYAYSFTLGSGDVFATRVLAGCYYGWAWIGGSDGSIAKTGDKLLCVTDANVVYKVAITSERVDFK
ncbi:MAG: hypothetical protein HYZ24_13340 [Chloroflexi bacterium]|jgi:hypothetical protein|nr:hypothetical protein [Chloroflexota bacterium]